MEYQDIINAFNVKYAEGKATENALREKAKESLRKARKYARLAALKMEENHRLEKKAWASNKASWVNDVVVPLMKEVSRRTGIDFDLSDLRTFGLRAECPVFSVEGDREKECYVTFTPGDLKDFELFIDTGEEERRFPKGSIGAINGCNKLTEKVVSVETVTDNLRRRYPNLFKD